MSSIRPVRHAIDILRDSGIYRQIDGALRVGTLEFTFVAAFIGINKTSDLLLVIDTLVDKWDHTQQQVTALGRSLDLYGSRRPLTVILVGPPPSEFSAFVLTLSKVARVINVGNPTGPSIREKVSESLSLLLPLQLADLRDILPEEPMEKLRQTKAIIPNELFVAMESASRQEEQAVRSLMRSFIANGLIFAGDPK